MAYYNEIADYPVSVLRHRIAEGDLPDGTVDTRSISDVHPDEIGDGPAHFFAGIGGWPLALRWAGVPDDAPVWTGSCPCQPFSSANTIGARGQFHDGDLWPDWAGLISLCRPGVVFGEQVVNGAWIETVAEDFDCMGYQFAASVLCASLVNLPPRERVFFFAYDDRQSESLGSLHAPDVASVRQASEMAQKHRDDVRRLRGDGYGIPRNLGARRAYGNAIVPELAAIFIRCGLDALERKAREGV